MLSGEQGEAVQKCMKILVALGDIYGAKRMLPIHSVHSPGVSYRVTGDAGLNYVKDASAQTSFCIPTTLNNIGIDMEHWQALGIEAQFAQNQLDLSEAYRKMGAFATNSCAPYLLGNIPKVGEHVAWGESSAIAYVNSVLGARTNREGGPTALAAAVTGRVPEYGLHLDENRRATVVIHVEKELLTDTDFASLGYYAGTISGKGIPVFTGIRRIPTTENFKALCSAIASSGAVALFHMVGITPEAETLEAIADPGLPEYRFGEEQYAQAFSKFNWSGEVDFMVVGCPHASIQEFKEMAALLQGRRVRVQTWLCTAHQTKDLATRMGYTKVLNAAGVTIVCDTCPVLSPNLNHGFKAAVTNSGKLAHYIRGLWNVKSRLAQLEDCVNAAVSGRLE